MPGKKLNLIKQKISNIIKNKTINNSDKIECFDIDVSLPGIGINIGNKHVITKTINDIEFYFSNLGFNIISGYEIDSIFYNFDALNMSKTHPSRDEKETFYINENYLLRTHTSNMQIHIMKKQKPPLKFISYGKVYRRDSDISHTPMFHQVEGFVINKNISLGNLKYLLIDFLKFFFKKNIDINIRSSYFPFTEPSLEIDIKCMNCLGKGCQTCKYSGWIEILGCGLIHPNVLRNCSINNIYKGLAFGMGIERLSMIKYNINDLRLYFENDIDFLKQF
jgi:phenylalanyl-tRNA synthetase alpha chain